MRTFQKWLIVLGAFVFAYNAHILVHETGHAINLVATGGELDRIEISPLSWSYAHCRFCPEPRAVSWGGFLWGSAFPLLLFLTLWCLKSRLCFWALLIAVVSLIDDGIYMLGGALMRIGDSGALIRMGISPAELIVIAGVLILLGLLLSPLMGTLLGIGRGRSTFGTTLLVLSGIVPYLLAVAAFNLISRPQHWRFSTFSSASVLLLLPLMALLGHYAAGWAGGQESRRRSISVNWRAAALSIILGAGIVVGELLVFPPGPGGKWRRTTYFEDARHFAGIIPAEFDPGEPIDFDNPRYRRPPEVYWRIGEHRGRIDLKPMPRDVHWSKSLKKLIVVTSDGILALSPENAKIERLWKKRRLGPATAVNQDGTRIVVRGWDQDRMPFVAAMDLESRTVKLHELGAHPTGLAFLDKNVAVVSASREMLRFTFRAGKGWRLETVPAEFPGARIMCLLDGRCVWVRNVYQRANKWRGKIMLSDKAFELPDGVRQVVAHGHGLLVLTFKGAVYRIDGDWKLRKVREAKGRITGVGDCSSGLWIATDDGRVRTFGRLEKVITIDLPEKDSPPRE